ncbi:MAG: hypothetical protein M3R59_04885 [Verrucomicrobiota bacterium]|nr:hypothetical protein [Verrucomicrobiota bacterium]
MRTLTLVCIIGLLAASVVAQQNEVVVAAANASAPAPVAPAAKVTSDADFSEMMKILQAMKLQNDETLKKQQAAMDALDELEKQADQVRIFSKRG